MDAGSDEALDMLIGALSKPQAQVISLDVPASPDLPALVQTPKGNLTDNHVKPPRRLPKLMPRLVGNSEQGQVIHPGHISTGGVTAKSPPSTYWDQRNGNNLRNLSKSKPGTKEHAVAVKQSAGQFEALILNELMKQARGSGFSSDSDQSMKSYKEMFDQQITHSISTQGRGFGFANHIENSLLRNSSSIRPEDLDKQRSRLGKISTQNSAEISTNPVYEIDRTEGQ